MLERILLLQNDSALTPGASFPPVQEIHPTHLQEAPRIASTTPHSSVRYYSRANFESLPQIQRLDSEHRFSIKVVASVLPFKVNNYVVDQLIDWDRVPDDPMFRLTFPHRDMLRAEEFEAVARQVRAGGDPKQLSRLAEEIRMRMNPHPAGQMTRNVPELDGRKLQGMQHKYRETVLFFPSQGQTCNAYCTFCFRWPQFVHLQGLRFQSREVDNLVEYLRRHTEVTDVLFTGGDPMTMPTRLVRHYIEPLLGPGLEHVQNIRIGTKTLTFWPDRYVADPDAEDLLRLFEQVVEGGRHLALMAHFNHPKALSTDLARQAIRRVRSTGAEIRCQSPLVRHVNDDPDVWAELWETQVRLGCIPYYMFVARDTGPRHYFEISLERAYRIFREAYSRLSGLCRTVRGPSMSASPGKVAIDGIVEVAGEKVFVLHFIQARNPDWVNRPFFARFDPSACWLDDLKPAFGQDRFFFED